jgi:pyruvate dehydrogenase E2 component (dihydrolipoamide acetyltransferase)
MSATEVKVPDIGDFSDVEVIEVLVKPGDVIKAEQSLVTVESDKASMEIPSSTSGKVIELKVKLGDKISQGTPLALVETQDAAKAAPAAGQAASAPEPTVPKSESPKTAPEVSSTLKAPLQSSEIVVPDIGDFDQVEVIEVLVKQGDSVKKDQSLITVESDKASMEIPSSADGTIAELLVKVGDKISKGSLIAKLGGAAGAPGPATETTPKPASESTPKSEAEPAAPAPSAAASEASTNAVSSQAAVSAPTPAAALPDAGSNARRDLSRDTDSPIDKLAHASPSVRQFARELGVELNLVTGSAPKGRITREDVQQFVKSALTHKNAGAPASAESGKGMVPLSVLSWPSLDFSKFGATETVALSRIKKISGPNLARNWAMIPHVTQFDEADVTELEAFRKSTNDRLDKAGTKVTMLAFVMKACVAALRKFPNFNSSLDAEGANLILKKYIHIGFAADTPNGLVVPVIRDCDQKGITQLAGETAELAAKAREGKLTPAEMQGASFTISSLGGVGGTAFTPIINAPEVAILGLSRSDIKPHWDGTAFVPRLKLPLSLSYDHRVIDGAQAARFTTTLGELLSDMRRVLL